MLPDEASGRKVVTVGQETVTVQGRYGACFLQSCRDFVELEPLRGTSFNGAAKLSPVTKLLAGTGAVSRYKQYRSQKFITVQELGCEQMRVSGCKNH